MSTESKCTTNRIPTSAEYLRLLENWIPTLEKWSHRVTDHPDWAYFGTGGHEHWAVQAQCTAFAALAVLATAPELNEARIGRSRDSLRIQALRMLRYFVGTHKCQSQPCVSGQSWGHSWISSLGFERCLHGIAALRPWLTGEDLERLSALMISESDFLLEGYPVVCAIDGFTGCNKPEMIIKLKILRSSPPVILNSRWNNY